MATSAATESESSPYVQVAALMHTVVLLALLAAWAVLGWFMVKGAVTAANPHRIRSYTLTLFLEWMLFAYVVGGVRRHGASTLVLGARWHSFRAFLRDVGIAAAFWVIAAALLQVLGRFLFAQTPRPNQEFLLPHGAGELALWIALSVSAGIGEETIFRGYLQKQFMAFTKNAPAGILFSALAFGGAHAYQGSRMTILIAAYGLMFGILAHWRRSVRPGMIAHAWQDSLGGLLAILKSC